MNGLYLAFVVSNGTPLWLNDKFLDSIKQIESHGNTNAVSPVGARGAYQFMESTWREVMPGVSFDMAYDEPTARDACKKYFLKISNTLTKWEGVDSTMDQCLAAYNGGMGRLRKCHYDISQMPSESRQYVVKFHKEYD